MSLFEFWFSNALKFSPTGGAVDVVTSFAFDRLEEGSYTDANDTTSSSNASAFGHLFSDQALQNVRMSSTLSSPDDNDATKSRGRASSFHQDIVSSPMYSDVSWSKKVETGEAEDADERDGREVLPNMIRIEVRDKGPGISKVTMK